MKLSYRTNIYEGPKTIDEIIKLSKKLKRNGWETIISDPRVGHGYGPPVESISGEICGLTQTLENGDKIFSRRLGEIKPGRIETHDYDTRLEDFLANYQFENLKGGNKK
jgi:hypothetical protein